MSSIKEGNREENSEIREKLQKLRKEKKGFTTKEKASSNLSTSLVSGKRTNTLVLCHSTRSFGNKPLVTLD